MYFSTKSYLKNNRYHTAKHTLSGPVKELDETAEATVEATMEDAENLWTLFWFLLD